MISNFDRFLPPVNVWCIFIIVWFLAVSALEGVKSFIRGLFFVIVLSFILLSFLGPLALLPLFLYALLKSITAFSHLRKKKLLQRLRIGVGVCGIIIIVGLSVYSNTIKSSRTETDYILQTIRHKAITVEYMNENQGKVHKDYMDDLSELFQHEIDHLDGILFTDRIFDNQIIMRSEWERLFSA